MNCEEVGMPCLKEFIPSSFREPLGVRENLRDASEKFVMTKYFVCNCYLRQIREEIKMLVAVLQITSLISVVCSSCIVVVGFSILSSSFPFLVIVHCETPCEV
jgi:hypothetical protein